ncbi:MAG: hypothetical protein KDA98_13905 [Acidimicrobiales bacterium]|nr:hypothetical protein [Acidimicrobiales bacterium]
MTDRPVLALAADPGTTSRAVPLLGLLGRWVDVVSWQRRGETEPDAVLATTVDALERLAVGRDRPLGVWVRHHDQVDRARAAGAAVLLTDRPELEARGAVLVPPVGIELDRWPAVPPLVRARRREQQGLPEHHVVRIEGGAEPEGGAPALASASAAIVSGPATLLALALGTPTVTSGDTARRLGLRPGRDAEVARDPAAAAELADAVADDAARAAALSRRARRCAEHHLDLGRPARRVAEGLGMVPARAGGRGRLEDRLDELACPHGSPVRVRVADALAALTGDGRSSGA